MVGGRGRVCFAYTFNIQIYRFCHSVHFLLPILFWFALGSLSSLALGKNPPFFFFITKRNVATAGFIILPGTAHGHSSVCESGSYKHVLSLPSPFWSPHVRSYCSAWTLPWSFLRAACCFLLLPLPQFCIIININLYTYTYLS